MCIRDVQYCTQRQVYLSGQTLLPSLSGKLVPGPSAVCMKFLYG